MVDVAHLCLTSDALFMFSLSEQGSGHVCGHKLRKAEVEQDLPGPDFGGSGSDLYCCRRSDFKMSEDLVKWVALEQFIT